MILAAIGKTRSRDREDCAGGKPGRRDRRAVLLRPCFAHAGEGSWRGNWRSAAADIVRAIDVAAKDGNIARLVIGPDGILSVGMAQLHEFPPLSAASARRPNCHRVFRGMEQKATSWPRRPTRSSRSRRGRILQGLERYRTYFKDGLESLHRDEAVRSASSVAGEPYHPQRAVAGSARKRTSTG